MSTRKRVLFVINSLTGGGAERVMSTLLSASSDYRERYEIALALLDSEPAAYTTPDWLPVHRLDSRHSLPASVINLARVARSFRPDVSVSFLSRANFSTVLVAKRYGHKAIISERVNSSAHFGTGAKAAVSKAALRALYPRADAVITPSVGVADDLCENFGVRRDKTTVIANPIDVAAIGKLAAQPIDRPTAGPYLIAVGRLMPTKNFETLIAAYAQAQVAPALVILGRGPLEAALREQIAAANLTERVILAGFHENPFAVMHNALAYVSASRSEGFPNSLVEAMAVHLPVVSSNCASGPSEILAGKPRDQVVGIEYAPHGILTPVDDVDALASVIRSLDDPDLRHRYAEAAHARALTYDVAMATRRFWEVIEGSVR